MTERRLGPPRRLGPSLGAGRDGGATGAGADLGAARSAPPPSTGPQHKLESRWTLWYMQKGGPGRAQPRLGAGGAAAEAEAKEKGGWAGDELRAVHTFSTVEEWWRLYHSVARPSRLPGQGDYCLFREGIRPEWEHAANAAGGKWGLSIPKQLASRRAGPPAGGAGAGPATLAPGTLLDKWWLHCALACIGEVLDADAPPGGAADDAGAYEVCGVVLSARRGRDRIALWTRTAKDEGAQGAIGAALRHELELPAEIDGEKLPLKYETHGEASANLYTA